MAVGAKELIAGAFLFVLSIMCTVFGCTLVKDKNAYVLLPLMFYIFTPLPLFLCGTFKGSNTTFDPYSGGSNRTSMFANFGHFITGLFGASGPSMALVLAHTGTIGMPAMWLSLGSAALLAMAAGVVFWSVIRKPTEDAAF